MMKFKFLKKRKDILKLVSKENYLIRYIFFAFASFGIALNFNLFLSPNNIVIGGLSGLAIVARQLMGIPTTLFINSSIVFLLFIACFILGIKRVLQIVVGAVTYMIMVPLTEVLASKINIVIESDVVLLLIIAIIDGGCTGLAYRTGFNPGGSSIICEMISKYTNIPMGKANLMVNSSIILVGSFIFGIKNTLYAIFVVIFGNIILNIVLLGTSDSKICFVKSEKYEEISNNLIKKLNLGLTQLSGTGGIFRKKSVTFLVIVPFNSYYEFKKNILSIDDKAFILAHDCYTVSGGYGKRLIPF